jgi:hypothetical protein
LDFLATDVGEHLRCQLPIFRLLLLGDFEMLFDMIAIIPAPVEGLFATLHRTLLPDAEVNVLLMDQELSLSEEHFPAELAGFVELLLVDLLDVVFESEGEGKLL